MPAKNCECKDRVHEQKPETGTCLPTTTSACKDAIKTVTSPTSQRSTDITTHAVEMACEKGQTKTSSAITSTNMACTSTSTKKDMQIDDYKGPLDDNDNAIQAINAIDDMHERRQALYPHDQPTPGRRAASAPPKGSQRSRAGCA